MKASYIYRNNANEIRDFINSLELTKENIISLNYVNGQFCLFYFSEY